MNKSEKIIKILIIAVAVALVISASLGICLGVKHVKNKNDVNKPSVSETTVPNSGNIPVPTEQNTVPTTVPQNIIPPEGENVFMVEEEVDVLEVNAGAAEVNIIDGGSFYVSTDNRNIKCSADGRRLTVNTKHRNEDDTRRVTISVPSDKIFDKIVINAGAESFEAEILKAESLEMHIAAGNMYIDDVEITKRAQIDFAAGFLEVSSGKINDLRVNMAVGAIEIDAELTGRSEFTCGGGKINVDLPLPEERYAISLDSLLCVATLNGDRISKGQTYGRGDNIIDINGVAGAVTITTED